LLSRKRRLRSFYQDQRAIFSSSGRIPKLRSSHELRRPHLFHIFGLDVAGRNGT
jgi:hypothetical protein